MKSTLVVNLLLSSVSANIIFTHVPLTCDVYSSKLYYGCLRGQYCDSNAT